MGRSGKITAEDRRFFQAVMLVFLPWQVLSNLL